MPRAATAFRGANPPARLRALRALSSESDARVPSRHWRPASFQDDRDTKDRPASLAVVEVKVPSVTFQGRAAQEGFVAKVTDIVDELKAGEHPRARTFVNVTYAVDGTWGIAGKAYTNDDLGSAIAGAAG